MTPADKAKRTLTLIEIPRDELACRIAEASMGLSRPLGFSVAQAFAQMDLVDPGQSARWRRAADRAVAYVHECIAAGVQPS